MLVNIFKSITVNITVRTTVNITINIFYIYQATMVEDQEFKNRIKVTSSAEFYLLQKHVSKAVLYSVAACPPPQICYFQVLDKIIGIIYICSVLRLDNLVIRSLHEKYTYFSIASLRVSFRYFVVELSSIRSFFFS